ncbi:MAG: Sapep family Mn(2+)-dependent dipeptidase [Clostridia bacterium]|nr:Sapep family Mn(2+)-dependent dipeptidase [Clostridia bacterium]
MELFNNNYLNNSIKTLEKWIQIKSVKARKTSNAPFGKNLKEMLDLALLDAKNLGFEVFNYDGFIGEAVFGNGSDENGLAILCHLDVVPEGDIGKWQVPPYKLTVKDGKLYGRGVLDDKGSAVICLYALKELKDSGFIPNRKIKLIFGLDEESGWGCISHYKKVAVMPKEGFSPDGDFPVIYAEKGILHIEYAFEKSDNVLDVSGGDRINMVCDKVLLKLKNQAKNLVFEGRTAHGSTPEKGDNAIKKTLAFLVEKGEFKQEDYNLLFNNESLFSLLADETGALTFSPNMISVKNGKIHVKVDCRYPATRKGAKVKKVLKKVGCFKVISHKAPLYNSKQSRIVKTLLSVYNEYSKTNEEPIAIGGGTYARALESGVAFGPSNICDSVCHNPNEYMTLSDYEKCYQIYKQAIIELCK